MVLIDGIVFLLYVVCIGQVVIYVMFISKRRNNIYITEEIVLVTVWRIRINNIRIISVAGENLGIQGVSTVSNVYGIRYATVWLTTISTAKIIMDWIKGILLKVFLLQEEEDSWIRDVGIDSPMDLRVSNLRRSRQDF